MTETVKLIKWPDLIAMNSDHVTLVLWSWFGRSSNSLCELHQMGLRVQLPGSDTIYQVTDTPFPVTYSGPYRRFKAFIRAQVLTCGLVIKNLYSNLSVEFEKPNRSYLPTVGYRACIWHLRCPSASSSLAILDHLHHTRNRESNLGDYHEQALSEGKPVVYQSRLGESTSDFIERIHAESANTSHRVGPGDVISLTKLGGDSRPVLVVGIDTVGVKLLQTSTDARLWVSIDPNS